MVIILVIGSHPAIPKVEINAIIAMSFFIVHDMIGGRVENPSERAFDEPVGVNFKAGMPKDVVEQLPAHEGTKGKRVNWHERSGECENPYLNQSLPWVESKGSP